MKNKGWDKDSAICYVEIPARDLDKTKVFYQDVFHWEVKPGTFNEESYSLFRSGNDEMVGGFDTRLPVSDGGALLYIHVEDIDKTLDKIVNSGGSIIKEKFPIDYDHGNSAIFKDPNGNHLGLWQR